MPAARVFRRFLVLAATCVLTVASTCALAVAATAPFGARAGDGPIVNSASATAAPAPLRAVAVQDANPVNRTAMWIKRAREGRARIDASTLDQLRLTIGDLRVLWAVHADRTAECAGALLDILGFAITSGAEPTRAGDTPAASSPGASSPADEVGELALEALDAHFDPALVKWLALDVLPLVHSQHVERRLAAIALLGDRHKAETKLALFECAREHEARVRDAALRAMVGWEDDTVHAFFVELLTDEGDGDRAVRSRWAERHFASVHLGAQSREHDRFVELVKQRLSSTDWRRACQAVHLSKCLDHESIVPFLIESLSAWKARGSAGAQSLRMQFEILTALELRSGRSLGLHPENWLAWWQAVRKGGVRGVTPQTFGGKPESTKAGFFGLQVRSDRVTFVIDRSGSMEQPFGAARGTNAKARTRWREAIEELATFVEAMGAKARFNVVLFHDYAEAWHPDLVEASPENVAKVREWLSGTHPGGGTALLSGVERAMLLAPDGSVDLAKLECDTIIVLCDGDTNEGPAWVEPFLTRVNSLAQVVFHGVQIGGGGDGTLQRLARLTGGEFVASDG